MKVFFTYIYSEDEGYIYGEPSNVAGPLTFSSESGRSTARSMLDEGDLVFGVVSSNPGHGAVVPEHFKGRVVRVWQMTRQAALLTDYERAWSDFDLQWPYALRPIRTWEIADPPLFRQLAGYDNTTHTLRSVSSTEGVNELLGQSLLAVFRDHAQEVKLPPFKYPALQQRDEILRQRHPVRIEGYSVARADEAALNYVYVATLGKNGKTLKIGHATNPEERVRSFNDFRLSTEPQWILAVKEPRGPVHDAVRAEAALGEIFAAYRTEPNNNEIYVGLSAFDVHVKLATMK